MCLASQCHQVIKSSRELAAKGQHSPGHVREKLPKGQGSLGCGMAQALAANQAILETYMI